MHHVIINLITRESGISRRELAKQLDIPNLHRERWFLSPYGGEIPERERVKVEQALCRWMEKHASPYLAHFARQLGLKTDKARHSYRVKTTFKKHTRLVTYRKQIGSPPRAGINEHRWPAEVVAEGTHKNPLTVNMTPIPVYVNALRIGRMDEYNYDNRRWSWVYEGQLRAVRPTAGLYDRQFPWAHPNR